ncbi:MAG: hypothetical protein ACQEXG_15810 [Pseudomonadota bacterium]
MSLFFDDRRQGCDEAASYEADAGRRLLDYLKAVASHALAHLPPDARDWLKVPSMEPPAWHDPDEPAHLLNEAHRLFMALPAALPRRWNLDEEQARAAAVLVAIGAAVRATRGLAPAPALRLLDASLLLGVTVTRAHVEPWEPDAMRGVGTLNSAKEGHALVHGTDEEKAKRWAELQAALDDKMARRPSLSLTEARRQVADEMGASESTMKRRTHRPKWGQSGH